MPFLALGFKVLYIRGRAEHTLYLDHLVCSLRYQSVRFLALAATWPATRLLGLEALASGMAYTVTALAMTVVYLPLTLGRSTARLDSGPPSRLWRFCSSTPLLKQILGLNAMVAI